MWRRKKAQPQLGYYDDHLGFSGRLERPAVFCLHILIAVLVTVKIAGVVSEDTPFIVASRGTFADMFLAGVSRQGSTGYIYEIDACIASVNASIHTVRLLPCQKIGGEAGVKEGVGGVQYYNLPAVGLDVYDALTTPIEIRVVQLRDNPREVLPRRRNGISLGDLETVHKSATVSGVSSGWLRELGVESAASKRSFFNSLVQMEVLFRLRTLHRELDHVQLFDWEITALYDFISRGGRIELSLAVKGSHVHLDQSMHWELGLDMLLSALALLSQLLSQPAGSRQGRVQLWRAVSGGADVGVLLGSLLDLSDYLGATNGSRAVGVDVTGVACMLAWARTIQHLEAIPPYDTLILAMQKGTPVVARFLVGSIPLLMGFAGLGMALFSEHSNKFASLESSCVTLFSVLNGDVLLETAREIRPAGVVGDVFLVAFVCIFVYSGLNVFISIIQDAYMSAKDQIATAAHPRGAAEGRLGEGEGAALLHHRLAALEGAMQELTRVQREFVATASASRADAAEGLRESEGVGPGGLPLKARSLLAFTSAANTRLKAV